MMMIFTETQILSIDSMCVLLGSFGINIFPTFLWLQHVYDKNKFSFDDKMGEADFDIIPFIEAVCSWESCWFFLLYILFFKSVKILSG